MKAAHTARPKPVTAFACPSVTCLRLYTTAALAAGCCRCCKCGVPVVRALYDIDRRLRCRSCNLQRLIIEQRTEVRRAKKEFASSVAALAALQKEAARVITFHPRPDAAKGGGT